MPDEKKYPVDPAMLVPGQRIRVSFEGRVIPREDLSSGAAILTEGGAIWAFPLGSTFEVLED